MLKKDIKYSYRDVTIVPAKVSEIEHRKDCNPFYPSGTLPLFTAPMDSVVGLENYELYEQHKIIPIIPRTVSLEQRLEVAKTGRWVAYGLEEFENIFTVQNPGEGYKALIDVANGHMKKLYTLVKKAKALNPNLTVMIGNIANPETYEECCKAGVDYVRCGIGGGNCCFVGDTKITLSNGLKKPISALDIGLEVLTKAGPHRITNVIRKEADKLIKINNNITCTPEHEIFVINKKDQDLVNEENLNDYGFYIKACELNKDIHLLVSIEPEFKRVCKECGKVFNYDKDTVTKGMLKQHISKVHNMCLEDYLIKHEYGGNPPLCACGCGEPVHLKSKGGWTFNKYVADSHVGKALTKGAEIEKERLLAAKRGKKINVDPKQYFLDNYSEELMKKSAKDFLSKHYTLSDLEAIYKVDRRTLTRMWLTMELVTEDEWKEVTEYNKFTVPAEIAAEKCMETSNVYLKILWLIKEHPNKFTIHSAIEEYNKSTMEKILTSPMVFYKQLKRLYGDMIDIYLAKGFHSQEEFRFTEVLSFYHPTWDICLGYMIGTKPKNKFIYDICINSKLILEYQSNGQYHNTNDRKIADKEKRKIAKENNYIFREIYKKDITNPTFINTIEKWLNS